jgi:hypothetical protein
MAPAIPEIGEMSMKKKLLVFATIILTFAIGSAVVYMMMKPKGLEKSQYLHACAQYHLEFGHEFFGAAELYLATECSSFPGVRILTPINLGKKGIGEGYIEFPFDLQPSETITFTLLDDDDLTKQEEVRIIDAASVAGKILIEYQNTILRIPRQILLPREQNITIQQLVKLGAEQIISYNHDHPWDPYGSTTYTVPDSLPPSPALANPLTISDRIIIKFERMDIKVYKCNPRE